MTIEQGRYDESTHQFCAWCGGRLLGGAGFCPACGEAVVPATEEPDADDPTAVVRSLLGDGGPFHGEAEQAPAPRPDSRLKQGVGIGRSRARGALVAVRGRLAPRRGRWLPVVAAAVAALLLASMAGAWGYRYLRDQPVHQHLDAAARSFGVLTQRLTSASDLEQVTLAGAAAEDTAGALAAHERGLRHEQSSLGRRAHALVAAELGVARSSAKLADLGAGELNAWGPVHDDLDEAVRAVSAAESRLRASDTDAADAVPDLEGLVPGLEKVVGQAVAASAQDDLADALGQLAAADSATRIRSVASRAASDEATLRAAHDGVDEDARASLKAAQAVYAAVAELAVLDGDHLDAWGDQRVGLSTALANLSGPAQASGRAAVRNIDAVVRKDQALMAEWKQSYRAAVQQKADDAAALERYRSKMDALMHRYSGLRQDLADWIAMVEDPASYVTWDDAYTELYDAESERQKVLDAMNAVDVPEPVQDAHAELVGVVDDAIAAVRSATSGVSDAQYCTNTCYYKDTPGWRRFVSESSRISDAYGVAVDSWQAMVDGTALSIRQRELPAMPRI